MLGDEDEKFLQLEITEDKIFKIFMDFDLSSKYKPQKVVLR